jgi:hypothetical protein
VAFLIIWANYKQGYFLLSCACEWVATGAMPTICRTLHPCFVQRPNSSTKSRQKSCYSHSALLCSFTLRFNFFKLTQPLTFPLSLCLWVKKSIHLNIESENFEVYAQKPQRNCRFMNSASGVFQMGEIRLQYKTRWKKWTPSNGMRRLKRRR